MESYHDYLEHVRSHKYIRKEQTSSGKWRYYYDDESPEKKKKPLLVKDTPITSPGDLDEIHERAMARERAEEELRLVNIRYKMSSQIYKGKKFVENFIKFPEKLGRQIKIYKARKANRDVRGRK